MADSLSQRIVDFIAGMPHFQHEHLENRGIGARRITDGSLVIAADDDEDAREGFVLVDWQGDASKRTRVHGQRLAALEIEEGVRHWVANGTASEFRAEFAHMASHFELKTGGTIECGIDLDRDQWVELGRLVRKVGLRAAMMALGKIV